jgi:hypothetical protein
MEVTEYSFNEYGPYSPRSHTYSPEETQDTKNIVSMDDQNTQFQSKENRVCTVMNTKD